MQTEKLSFGILVLIESISKRKLNELNVKLTKSIQKFYHKFGYYPQYIHNINDYCLQSINIIKKHVLLGNYPTNKLYKITFRQKEKARQRRAFKVLLNYSVLINAYLNTNRAAIIVTTISCLLYLPVNALIKT